MAPRTLSVWRQIHANPGCGIRDLDGGSNSAIHNSVATLLDTGRIRCERVEGTNAKAYFCEQDPPLPDEAEAAAPPPPAPPPLPPNSVFQLGDQARQASGDAEPAPLNREAVLRAVGGALAGVAAEPDEPELQIPTLGRPGPKPDPLPQLPLFKLSSADELEITPDMGRAQPIRLDATVTRALFRWLDRLGGTRLQELLQEAS